VTGSHAAQAVVEKQQAALTAVGNIEEAMVKGFPFTVPSTYDNLPQLKVCNINK
jgi:peptidylprolyl isomerase